MPDVPLSDDPRRIDRGHAARGTPPEADSDRREPRRRAGPGPNEAPDEKDEDGKDDEDGEGGKGGKDEKDEKEGHEKPSPIAKPWVRVAIAVAVLLVLVAGGFWLWRYLTHGRFVESTNDAYLQADQVTVAAKVSGTVLEVFVADNQQVHAGDRLVRIDAAAARLRVQQALAQAAQARAIVAQYRAQIAEQRATIAQASAAVDGAEAQRRYAQREVDRYAPLAETGAEPAEQLSQRVSNRDQAVATLRQNQATAVQAARRVATLSAQIGSAEAQVVQAETQARQAQIDVDSALVRASIDGRVGDRQVRVGTEAQVGTRFMTLVPVQALYLVANFKETQIGQMRVGQPATIKVDALGGTEVSGTVDSFAPATGASFALIPANNATGNFTKIVQRVPVRIRVDMREEAAKVLVPGLSVEVSVDTLGSKDEKTRRENEADADEARRKDLARDRVSRDRAQPASGAGR